VVINKENENDIALRCEALKASSNLVAVSAPGIVYINENIWIGTNRIKEALIRFKVKNSWLDDNKLTGSDVMLFNWEGSKWVQVDITEKAKDTTYTYFEARINKFSHFAVSGIRSIEATEATPKEVKVVPIEPTATATIGAASIEKAPGFGIVLAIYIFFVVYLSRRKR
jgi:PGF-pre-PGF domain-containing protein